MIDICLHDGNGNEIELKVISRDDPRKRNMKTNIDEISPQDWEKILA